MNAQAKAQSGDSNPRINKLFEFGNAHDSINSDLEVLNHDSQPVDTVPVQKQYEIPFLPQYT